MSIAEIIERLEKAKGPDRGIDQDIFHALDLCPKSDGGCDDFRAPAYTGSVDCALSLVPEGSWWDIGTMADGLTYGACVGGPNNLFDTDRQLARSPALALCIAALRAFRGEGATP